MDENVSLELVRDFVNTNDVDDGIDELATLDGASRWLRENGLGAGDLSDAEIARVRDVREAIRELLKANNGLEMDPRALDVLDAAGREAPLRVGFAGPGGATLLPAAAGAAAVIGRVLAAVQHAQAEGTWGRLKACAAGDCQWAYLDRSRNHSRHWCSMEVCGNRAKARSYRARSAR